MDWFDDWALTLAVFTPLVGMAIVMLIPRAEENAIKLVALVTSLATLAVGIGILADFNFDNIVNLQDFNRLAANFGLSASAGGPTPEDWAALAALVPEPSTVLILPMAGLALARRSVLRGRRGRRSVDAQ